MYISELFIAGEDETIQHVTALDGGRYLIVTNKRVVVVEHVGRC